MWPKLISRQPVLLCFFVGVVVVELAAAKDPASPPVRARSPEWPPEVQDLFFPDVRNVLQGPRPDYQRLNIRAPSRSSAAADTDREPRISWHRLIDTESIETEVKRTVQLLARDTREIGSFKAGGCERCHEHFTLLAVWFAIAGDYDGNVRWKLLAPAIRDVMAETAWKCKSPTEASFLAANEQQQLLAELMRGGTPEFPATTRPPEWRSTAERPPIMQRMELGREKRLDKWLATPREFRRRQDKVATEAQVLCALAEVIRQEGFEYWDDEVYSRYGSQLREAARDLADSARQGDYQKAQVAFGRVNNACSDCHAGYRG